MAHSPMNDCHPDYAEQRVTFLGVGVVRKPSLRRCDS